MPDHSAQVSLVEPKMLRYAQHKLVHQLLQTSIPRSAELVARLPVRFVRRIRRVPSKPEPELSHLHRRRPAPPRQGRGTAKTTKKHYYPTVNTGPQAKDLRVYSGRLNPEILRLRLRMTAWAGCVVTFYLILDSWRALYARSRTLRQPCGSRARGVAVIFSRCD